jgi:hypothetical protein
MSYFITEIQKTKRWDEFEKWWKFYTYQEFIISTSPSAMEMQFHKFCLMKFEYQQGVLLDFLREKGIFIEHDFTYPKYEDARKYVFKPYSTNESKFAQIIFNHDYNLGLQEAILKAFNL